jgi:predicted HTH transcriptional regulator
MSNGADLLYKQFVDGKLDRINQIISDQEVENNRLEFKENTDGTGPIPRLLDSNKDNLAKALSGFANSGGGVIVWGIEAKDHKPIRKRPIPDIQKFTAELYK